MGTLFYAGDSISFLNLRFENDVKMYGTQALSRIGRKSEGFENDVKMYGTQAGCIYRWFKKWFENDVKMYGTQASKRSNKLTPCLRMM